MRKNIGLVLLGVFIALFGVYAYWFYNLSKTVSSDHALLSSVVSYLNQQIQAKVPVPPATK